MLLRNHARNTGPLKIYRIKEEVIDLADRRTGQTHLNPNTGRPLHDGVYLFPTD